MKKTISITLVPVVVCTMLIIISCATRYAPSGCMGGYSNIMLNENVFQVSFHGNGFTGSERSSDFCLLRCAEVALSHGFGYFIIVDTKESSTISSYTTPTHSNTDASASIYGNTIYGRSQTTTSGGETYYISKPSTKNTILCYKQQPNINATIYNARIVSQSVRAKWGISSIQAENPQGQSVSYSGQTGNMYIEVISAPAFIRSEPNPAGSLVKEAKNGDRFFVLGKQGSWYKISLPDGKSGWIFETYTRVISQTTR